jgi:hypothetical protein
MPSELRSPRLAVCLKAPSIEAGVLAAIGRTSMQSLQRGFFVKSPQVAHFTLRLIGALSQPEQRAAMAAAELPAGTQTSGEAAAYRRCRFE